MKKGFANFVALLYRNFIQAFTLTNKEDNNNFESICRTENNEMDSFQKFLIFVTALLILKKDSRYQIVWENLKNNVIEKIIIVRDNYSNTLFSVNLFELENCYTLLDDMNSRDAFFIGKEIGYHKGRMEQKIIDNEEF